MGVHRFLKHLHLILSPSWKKSIPQTSFRMISTKFFDGPFDSFRLRCFPTKRGFILPTGTAPQVSLREASGRPSALRRKHKLSLPLSACSFSHLTDFQNSNLSFTKFLSFSNLSNQKLWVYHENFQQCLFCLVYVI